MPGIVPADDLPQAGPSGGNAVPQHDLPQAGPDLGTPGYLKGIPGALAQGATGAEAVAGNPLTRFALGAASPFLGLAQLGAHLSGSAIQKLSGKYPEFVQALDQHLAELQKLKEQGQKFYGGGADVAGLAGAVASPLPLGAAKAIPEAAGAVGKIAGGATLGGIYGATTPVEDAGSDFWSKKVAQTGLGALAGGALPAAGSLLKAPASAIYHVIEPWLPGGQEAVLQRALVTAAGPRRQEIIQALQQAKGLPGENLSAGQAATAAGSAEFAGLQKLMEGVQPSEYTALENAQRATRVGVLGTPEEGLAAIQAAKAARVAAAQPLYQAAEKEILVGDPRLQQILSRPSMGKAFARAEELSKERGLSFIQQRGQAARLEPSSILGENGQPAFVRSIPATSDKFPVGSLQTVKMALDDMVKNPERFGIGASEEAAIKGTRSQLIEWLSKNASNYEKANSVFAQMSQPVNQAEILTQLTKTLNPAMADLGASPGQAAGAFARAQREAPQLIKRATGEQRYTGLGQILSPEQQTAVQALNQSLGRQAQYEQLATAGKPAAMKMLGVIQKSEIPHVPILERSVVIGNAILSRLQGKVNEQMLQDLATRMRDPREVVRLLQQMPTPQRTALIRQAITGAVAVPAAQQAGQ